MTLMRKKMLLALGGVLVVLFMLGVFQSYLTYHGPGISVTGASLSGLYWIPWVIVIFVALNVVVQFFLFEKVPEHRRRSLLLVYFCYGAVFVITAYSLRHFEYEYAVEVLAIALPLFFASLIAMILIAVYYPIKRKRT
jgi:hypothetical protein